MPRRRARIRQVAAGVVGRGARRHRRTPAQGDRREPPARDHVSRRPSGRGRLRQPRAAGVGRRRPQQPHQRLLLVGAARAFSVVRQRSAVARLRQREDDPAAVVASRDRPLLQPARAADHRRADGRRDADRDRSPPVEHLRQGERVDARVLGDRGRAAARDGEGDSRRGSLRPRVHARPGSTGAATCAPTGPIWPSPSTISSSR